MLGVSELGNVEVLKKRLKATITKELITLAMKESPSSGNLKHKAVVYVRVVDRWIDR